MAVESMGKSHKGVPTVRLDRQLDCLQTVEMRASQLMSAGLVTPALGLGSSRPTTHVEYCIMFFVFVS